MADAFTLPRVYPSLQSVDFWVDPNTHGARIFLGTVAHVPRLSPIIARLAHYVMPLARILGSEEGVLAYEIEGSPAVRTTVVFTGRDSFLMAAIPAALSAMQLVSPEPYPAGIVPVNKHVDKSVLMVGLTRWGIRVECLQESILHGG
jgi:hypothetical protein